MLSKIRIVALFALLMLALGACTTAMPVSSMAPTLVQSHAVNSTAKTEVLKFDVAEDMNRFIFNQDIVYEDGMPADGSSFITRGYIYEYGTLDGTNGVNADGSPEFPDKVIGEWICEGYMINDAGHATGGVWVFSNQFFQLGDKPGAQTLITQGYELADIDVAISRAITGGTGKYSTARGESTQKMLGLNASQGVNLRIEIAVQK
jgi:hypothetical protein